MFLWRGGRRGQVVHGGGGGVVLLLRGVSVHQAGDGDATTGLLVASVLQGVGDPAKVAPHLVQLLRGVEKNVKSQSPEISVQFKTEILT